MTDANAFLAAIIDRPDDDLPRLVYADYLEESGDADRAEFIRVQCELARLPADHPDRPALAAREEALLDAYKPRWVVPGLRGAQMLRRGFVEAVRTTAEWLLAASGRLFGSAPVRELRLQSAASHVDALARLADLARVEALDLSNHGFGTWPLLESLLASAPLAGLRRLTLRNNQMWPDAVRALAATPVAGRLKHLNLSGNPVADVGAEYLAAEPGFAGLTELVVRGDKQDYTDCIHAAGAAALARSRTLTGLRRLDLRDQYVGDAGLIDLARSPNAAGLVELDVSYNEIGLASGGDTAIEVLTESPHLGRLRLLNLGGSRLNRLAAAALAGWPRLRDGLRVDLRGCEMDAAAVGVILGSRSAGQFLLDLPE